MQAGQRLRLVEVEDSLKSSITNPPVLVYAKFGQSFILGAGASNHGLGMVLHQDGRNKVIMYAN